MKLLIIIGENKKYQDSSSTYEEEQALITKEKEELLCSKYNKIYRFLAIRNVVLQDRDDLMQEIFINAYNGLGKLREIEKIDSWLWTIANNVVNQYWAKVMDARKQVVSLEAGRTCRQAAASKDIDWENPLDGIDKMCDRDELIQAFKYLKEKELTLLRLHYYEGYRLKEIAEILGESESAVKSRHQRAIMRLRQILEEFRQKEMPQDDGIEDIL